MATLVLGIVGGVVGSAIPGVGTALGLFIGSAVGGLIDNFLLYPAIFPAPNIQGPRLFDIQAQTASEGSPMKWSMGPLNRVAGTIVWLPKNADGTVKFIENKNETHVGKGGGGQTATTYTYFVDLAIAVCDSRDIAVKRIVKIYADTKVIYDGRHSNKYESLALYYGNQTSPDPTIAADRGIANTPNYKHSVMAVFKKFALADFGNRIPTFTFVVRQQSNLNAKGAAQKLLRRAGLAPSQFSVDRIPDCFKGMTTSGPQRASEPLALLASTYGLVTQEKSSKIHMFKRGDEYVIPVQPVELAARESGDVPPRPVQFRDTDKTNLPSASTVRFINAEDDMQQGSQSFRRAAFSNEASLQIDVPITLIRSEANSIARRAVLGTDGESVVVSLQLPPRYSWAQEGDVITFSRAGTDWRIFCQEVSRGVNGLVVVNGFQTAPHLYEALTLASDQSGGRTPYIPPNTVAHVMDIPSLIDETTSVIGVHFAARAENASDSWRGAYLYSSTDGTTYSFVRFGALSNESTMGTAVTALPPGDTTVWDEETELDVHLDQGTLASCSESECLAGANRAAIRVGTSQRWEVIGFQNATSLGSGAYKLSRLLRGLRGTERDAEAGHTGGEPFVLLVADTSVGFGELGSSALGVDEYFKVPALDGSLSQYVAQRVTVTGASMRPFAPTHITLKRSAATGDLQVSWTRRGKRPFQPLMPAPLAPDESPETYDVEVIGSIYDAPVKRTTRVTGSTSWTYTAAEQSSDSVTTLNSYVHIRVYQVSGAVGRGEPGDAIEIPENVP